MIPFLRPAVAQRDVALATSARSRERTPDWDSGAFTPLPLSPRTLMRAASAAGFACLLNLFPLELVGGTAFLLGPFLSWIFVLRLPAIVAIAIAGLPVLVAPAGTDPLMLPTLAFSEVIWFVLARDLFRARHPVLVDALFWLCVGTPLTFLFCHLLARWPAEFTALEIGNRLVNQFAAVAVATYFNRDSLLGHRFLGRRTTAGTLRGLVFDYVFILAAVPLALVALGFSQLLRQRARDEGELVVLGTAQRVAGELSSFLALHRATIASGAEIIQNGTPHDHVLQAIHRSHPAFVTMLTADATGRLEHASPHDMERNLAGLYLGDREYFTSARDQSKPVVSGVFRGRGFGQDVLVAVSAPIFGIDRSFEGILEGSVLVSRFREYSAQPGGVEIIIVDPSARVVHASPEAGLEPLQFLRDHPLHPLVHRIAFGTGYTYDHEPKGTASRRMLAYAVSCGEFPFVVIAQLPQLAILKGAREFYLLMGLIAAGVLATASVVTRTAWQQVLMPLERFSTHVSRQIAAGSASPIAGPEQALAQEIGLVYKTFNQLARRLQLSHDELRESNAALDARVADRTRDLEIARQHAEAANRSKTNFLAMTSHEIRTPLNAVIGLADALLASNPQGAVEDRLRTIRDSARSLIGVVNDLLDTARIETGQLELRPAPVHPASLCEELHQLFADRARDSHLDFHLRLPDASVPWVSTDPQRLRQILVNFLGNALKYTSTGSVVFSLKTLGSQDGQATMTFAVQDTGPGIPADEQARLFEPYFRASTAGSAPGTGLGLPIARRLVELLGGTLTVDSVLGIGSTFACTFRWPVVSPPPLTPASGPPPHPAIPWAPLPDSPVTGASHSLAIPPRPQPSARVLAVDDNVANREVLHALLENHCASIVTVESGFEALDLLRQHPFDVALVDLEMPDIDGFTLARRIRSGELGPEIARLLMIAVSAHPRDHRLEECLTAGFDDYLEKPIERARLLAALRASRDNLTDSPQHG